MNKYLVSITNLPENRIFRALFRKKTEKYFCFVYKQGNILINIKNNTPVKEQIYEITTFDKIEKHARYFIKTYKASNFKYYDFIDSPEFFSSFTALRFFKLKFEELYSVSSKKKILKKWHKYASRYLGKKELTPIIQELEKCKDMRVLLSFWPIEISRSKPWIIYNEVQFRYFENLQYYNFFSISKILTASFEEENPSLMQDLYVRWESLINEKKKEAFNILENEYNDAQKNNDEVSMEEIRIIKENIIQQTANLNLPQHKTPNSLFKYWPTILYPGPDVVKV